MRAWLTMAVQAGFVAGTLFSALSNLADTLNSRTLMFVGSLVGGAANAAVLIAPDGGSVIALRFVTGASLALVYPPAMKIAAGWFRDGRGLALGLLIGALTLGKAFPHLLAALFGTQWRAPMLLASVLAIVGGTLVLLDRSRWSARDRHGTVRPARDPENTFQPRRAARHLRIPGPHVGAVRDVDVGGGLCRGRA